MASRLPCEFLLVRYVPDPVKGEFANIGVVLREAGAATATVRFTRDWSRVRCLHADADVEMLESLEAQMAAELAGRLQAAEVLHGSAKPLLAALEDTLSNSVQITEMRATLAESVPAELEQLMRLYVEPLRAPAAPRSLSGRAGIARAMRTEFERAGVWALMRKRIRAAEYTSAGDPLRLDCGYRTGPQFGNTVRMFQAVGLETDVEGAKGLAYSAAGLRAGVQRVERAELELTAVVEHVGSVSDSEQYGFGVEVMEREAIRVLTVADLGRVAETARRELGV